MNLNDIKPLALKYKLLTVDFSPTEILALRKDVHISCYAKIWTQDETIHCEVYNFFVPLSDLRQELKTLEDASRFFEKFLKLRFCKGFQEKNLKPDVKLNEVLISFEKPDFKIRSRKCTILKNFDICEECVHLSTVKPNQLKQLENQCKFCDKKTGSKALLSKHIRKHHSTAFRCTWDGCKKHFGCEKNLSLHLKRHFREFSFYCDICDKGFVSERELKLHKVCHENLRSFVCFVCGKLFLRKTNLTEHMKIHTGLKSYSCDLCDSSFSRPGNLVTHKSRKHVSEGDKIKKFKCSTCDKNFHALQQLTRHSLVHTGARPFKCDVCKTSFARSDHLKTHRLKIHRIGLKPKSHELNKTMQLKSGDFKTTYEIPSPSENLVINTDHDSIHKDVDNKAHHAASNKDHFVTNKDHFVTNKDHFVTNKAKDPISTGEDTINEDYTVESYVEHDINSSNILHLDIQEQVTIVHIAP